MKMTKIQTARKVVEQNGSCIGLECKECFTTPKNCGCNKLVTVVSWTERKIKLAKAYIKRHEGKSKKKPDSRKRKAKEITRKVSRPNFRQYLRDKINMKIRVTPELSEELQKICFEEGVEWMGGDCYICETVFPFLFIVDHRPFGYTLGVGESEDFFRKQNRPTEATEYDPETDTLKVEPKPVETPNEQMIRICEENKEVDVTITYHDQLIDDYINSNEPVVKENFTPEPEPIFMRMTARSEGRTFERAMEILSEKFQKEEIKINWVEKGPQPMTIEEVIKAFRNKEKIYDVGYDYLDEIDLAKYDYLKIARDVITAESDGEVCLLITDLKNTYKTHAEAYKVFASRR